MSEEVVAAGPKREAHLPYAVPDRVADRAMGSLATHASPRRIYTGRTICFPSNGALALDHAWESMLKLRDGNVRTPV